MGIALATVTLDSLTGFTDDSVMNTFVVDLGATAVADSSGAGGIPGFLASFFYNSENGAGDSIAKYIGQSIDRSAGASVIRVYDITTHLDGSPYGSPVYEDAFQLDAAIVGAGPEMPSEIAAVLTLRGVGAATAQVEVPDSGDAGTEVDRPRQRRTGRVYIGPLNTDATDPGDGGRVRLKTAVRTAMLDAAEDFHDRLVTEGWNWAVWSRKDAVVRDIVSAEVDNAFDVQRRRGMNPTVRSSRTF